jgi:hypothetical protein
LFYPEQEINRSFSCRSGGNWPFSAGVFCVACFPGSKSLFLPNFPT